MSLRIVYVGPAMSGRRTSIASVLRRVGQQADALTLAPNAEHRFLHRGHELSVRLSAERSSLHYRDVDGTEQFDAVRREVDWLVAASGIVFVLDSQPARQPANVDELEKLRHDLSRRGVDLERKPLVFQANKRDLTNLTPTESLRERFRTARSAVVESAALQGTGTLEAISTLIDLVVSQV